MPNFGWMTLRWMPIWPRPAATATGLCETTQTLSGKRPTSIGKPIAGLTARTPSASRAETILLATSLVWCPTWWNSRLATDRAGLRIGSRFIRQTRLISPFVHG